MKRDNRITNSNNKAVANENIKKLTRTQQYEIMEQTVDDKAKQRFKEQPYYLKVKDY